METLIYRRKLFKASSVENITPELGDENQESLDKSYTKPELADTIYKENSEEEVESSDNEEDDDENEEDEDCMSNNNVDVCDSSTTYSDILCLLSGIFFMQLVGLLTLIFISK